MKHQCDRVSSCDITRERSRVSVCDPPYRGSHARGHTVCPAAGGHTGAAGRVSSADHVPTCVESSPLKRPTPGGARTGQVP